MKATHRLTWLAERDGVAHAHRGRLPQTLCGRRVIDERFAWPAKGRCPDCLELAGKEAAVRR